MKNFEIVQSPQNEDNIKKGGSAIGGDFTLKPELPSVEQEATNYESIKPIEDILSSKKEVDPSTERMNLVYSFDIRYKHPDSQVYYDKRYDAGVVNTRKSQQSVFSKLDGKDLEIDGKVVGTFKVMQDLIPQCTYIPEKEENGEYVLTGDCGWFFQIKIKVAAKYVDLPEATRSILSVIGDTQNISYMTIEKVESNEGTISKVDTVKKRIVVDVSVLKNNML